MDDLVNGLVHQVQENVVPRLEHLARQANQRIQQTQQATASRRRPRPWKNPPSNIDIVYLTDRFMVSSQPAIALNPTFTDTGRDIGPSQSSNTGPTSSRKPSYSRSKDSTIKDEISTGENPLPSSTTNFSDREEIDPRQRRGRLLSDLPEASESCDTIDIANTSSNLKEPAVGQNGTNNEEESTTDNPITENPQDGTTIETLSSSMDPTFLVEMQNSSSVVDASQSNEDLLEEGEQSVSENNTLAQNTTEELGADMIYQHQIYQRETSSNHEQSAPDNNMLAQNTTEELGADMTTQHQIYQETSNNDASESPVDTNYVIQNIDPQSTPTSIQHTNSHDEKTEPPSTTLSTSICQKEIEVATAESKPGARDKDLSHDTDRDTPLDLANNGNDNDSETTGLSAENTASLSSASREGVSYNHLESSFEAINSKTELPKQPIHQPTARSVPYGQIKNSPGNMVTYLDNQHGRGHYLAFSLLNEPPDDRTLLLFRRQIVQLGWSGSPCPERSETPAIPQILKACYAIHAYMQLDQANSVLVYCSNGRTRTAIVAACYLKFSGLVESAEQGFIHFLIKRGTTNPPNRILEQLPPSLKLFFRQFDKVLDLGGFLNRKPLLLRAIALQGLPVEDQPCLDIWDSSKQHVYSSHPDKWQNDASLQRQMSFWPANNRPVSQWAEEEGFYRVNVVLDGDFLVLCRFGGDFAQETSLHDPSKILFRYTNTTGFLSGAFPYECHSGNIDLTRRYADHLDDEDFLVTLLFEADWEQVAEGKEYEIPETLLKRLHEPSDSCGGRVWRSHEEEAIECGFNVIFDNHSASPSAMDINTFQRFFGVSKIERCPVHLIVLALQLTNYEYEKAKNILMHSPVFSWWADSEYDEIQGEMAGDEENEGVKSTKEIEDMAAQDIFKVLDLVDVSAEVNSVDRASTEVYTNERPNANEHSNDSSSTDINKQPTDLYGLCSHDTGWMVPSIMYPHRNEITGSFPRRLDTLPPSGATSTSHITSIAVTKTDTHKPNLPYFSHDKPKILPLPSKRVRGISIDESQYREAPSYDPTLQAAIEAHSQLLHTGIRLDELTDLDNQSKNWNGRTVVVEEEPEESHPPPQPEELENGSATTGPRDSSMNREAKEKKEKKWIDSQKLEAEEKEKAAREKRLSQEKIKEENEAPNSSSDEIPLKDDPAYAKYFKMMKMGMPREQVLHAMKRDEKDESILNLDPNKSLKSQLPSSSTGDDDDGPPLKDDPQFSKYFKMIKMGMPREQVLHAMKRDEKDPAVLDLDPHLSLKSQQTKLNKQDDGPPLKEDPDYSKYFKMLAMKLPMGAVKNALVRDGKDPSVMDLDPNKSVKSQIGGNGTQEDSGPPLKDDPDYAKYFKMLAMKLPIGAVKNALARDGKDPNIMDLDPNKSVKSQLGAEIEEKDSGIPLKDDPEYAKYFKMESMGLPLDAVKNALVRDGKDPGIIDLDRNKSIAFQMKMKKSSSGPKKPVKKKKKVRRKKIYWNPIDPGKIKEDSMWNIVRDYVAMDKLKYDQKEFEELFTESADPSDQKKTKKPQKEAKKLVQVIDPKRSMNGGIVLKGLKTENKKIAEYVNHM